MFPRPQAVVFLSFTHSPICSRLLSLLSFSLACTFLSHACFRTPPPTFSLSALLCRVSWFPNLHVLCVLAVLVETHCASCSGYLRVKKTHTKKHKNTRSKHCTSGVLAGLRKRKHRGDILTAWERRWKQTETLQILCVFHWRSSLSADFEMWFWRHEGLRWPPDIMPPAAVALWSTYWTKWNNLMLLNISVDFKARHYYQYSYCMGIAVAKLTGQFATAGIIKWHISYHSGEISYQLWKSVN